MKKLSLVATVSIMLALLSALASPTPVMGSPARIEEPSFETVANWAYSETDLDFTDGVRSTAWKKQGIYSYLFSCVDPDDISKNAYCQILQSVDFTSIDRISFDAYLGADSTDYNAIMLVGATEVWTQAVPESDPVTPTEYLHQEVDLSGQTDIQNLIIRIFAAGNASNSDMLCYFDNIRIWGSYSDEVARTTVSNNFANYGDSVYMYGENIAVAVDTYKVAYYDGDGYKMGTDVVFDITVPPTDGVLQSEIRPADYEGAGAGFGTWHAVVYNTTGSMPASYAAVSKADPGYIITDSFYVEESCIPEFPTVIGGIGVAGLCFGIYYWKRKRKLDSKG